MNKSWGLVLLIAFAFAVLVGFMVPPVELKPVPAPSPLGRR